MLWRRVVYRPDSVVTSDSLRTLHCLAQPSVQAVPLLPHRTHSHVRKYGKIGSQSYQEKLIAFWIDRQLPVTVYRPNLKI